MGAAVSRDTISQCIKRGLNFRVATFIDAPTKRVPSFQDIVRTALASAKVAFSSSARVSASINSVYVAF